ncbi:MAG: thioether cross-link-forming SCIFF peptide maturase [Bacillota bacterium]|nr:thioether cross-link-forming SCIFF peptide maturase [Candidatus Fermentithermobacillaceae bacterium]HPZ78440.1 thioether cross-link-forming SCIFF peptide maturase [Bacillota bacterium]
MSRKVNSNSEQVHTFNIKGVDLAYDAATGSLHKLDPVGRGVLDYCLSEGVDLSRPELHRSELQRCISRLSPAFSPEEIEEAWNEIRLLAGKSLWGEDETAKKSESIYTDVADAEPDAEPAATEAAATEPADEVEGYANDRVCPVDLPPPKAMCLNVAHDCNLVCRYCFASQGRFGGNPMLMSAETARRAIDFLIDGSGSRRYLDVDFFGGEPLLAFDAVKDAIFYASRQGQKRGKEFRFTITTNCTLLSKDIIDFLNQWNVSVILSLDGRPETHNRMRKYREGGQSHDDAIRNALKLVESRNGTDYYIRGTYTRYNLDFYNDVKYLYDAGFRRLSLEPVVGVDADWAIRAEDLAALEQSYLHLVDFWQECFAKGDPLEFYHFEIGLTHGVCAERRITGCGAGYEYLAVTPEGDIYPCHQLVGQNEFAMGSIFAPSYSKMSALGKRFYDARVPNKPTCKECWARYLCGGGCHAGALGSTGNIMKPDPLSCSIMKLRLEFALYIQYLKLSAGILN